MEFLKENMVACIIVVAVIIIILLVNAMMRKRNGVKNAFSSIDVMLTKRCNEMENLVAGLKQYMGHEASIITKVTEIRQGLDSSKTNEDKIKQNEEMDKVRREINVAMEAYPDLKSNINLLHIQTALVEIEEQISAARRTYNAHVTEFNNFVQTFPISIIAMIFGYKKEKLFEATEEQKKDKNWFA